MHGIQQNDGVVLAGKPAWHGLGLVVENAPTVSEALKLAHLDWEVQQWALSATDGEDQRMAVPTHVANVRGDDHTLLGVVGKGYRPVQNAELAEFADSLGKEGDVVRVESAASIFGGRRVWFLLRGQSFSVKGWDDTIEPYLLVANGHDGLFAVRIRPTTVRVVCNNTLTAAIGEERSEMNVVLRHTGDIKQKLSLVHKALGMYQKQITVTAEKIDAMAARTIDRQELEKFYLDVYQKMYEVDVPLNPVSEEGKAIAEKAKVVIAAFGGRFDVEQKRVGTTAWAALNSVTGYVQHDAHVRGKGAVAQESNRILSQVFGLAEDRTNKAAAMALALV